MRTILLILSLSIFFLFTFSCGSSSGINFSAREIEQLQIGVTKKEFIDNELQSPYSKEEISFNKVKSTFYFYTYSQMPLGSLTRIDKKDLYLEFIDNILNGKLFNYSFNSENGFDIKKADEIIVNQSTKQEISNLLGNPNGEFLLPSNFVNIIVKDEYEKNIPEDAKKVLVYYFSYLKKVPFSFNEFITHKKFLLLYIDNKETLVKKVSAEMDTK